MRGSHMSPGRAAKACKGKTKGKFKACLKAKMKGHHYRPRR